MRPQTGFSIHFSHFDHPCDPATNNMIIAEGVIPFGLGGLQNPTTNSNIKTHSADKVRRPKRSKGQVFRWLKSKNPFPTCIPRIQGEGLPLPYPSPPAFYTRSRHSGFTLGLQTKCGKAL